MQVRTVERDDFIEYHLTVADVSVERAFARLAEILAREGIAVLHEKVYGPTRDRAAVLAIRRERLRARELPQAPCSYVEGRYGAGEFRGVQVLGIVPRGRRPVAIETVCAENGVCGRQLSAPGYRVVYLCSIAGSDPDTPHEDGPEHARRMLSRAEAALKDLGLSFAHVARTWVYLRDLLDCYGDFNQARTEFLQERGLTGGAGRAFPASTGIQGTSRGESCVMDLCAIEAAPETGIEVRPVLHSRCQSEAFAYGSSFSRATVVQLGGRRTVLVSGTASLDNQGRSLHIGDRTAQIVETVQCIAALLQAEGGSLTDICSATVFGKDRQTLVLFEAMTRRHVVPAFPYVSMLADVCRPELLVEIEALAVVGAGRDAETHD